MAEQRAQRRLAAILAADVVGYSRLMRADEAGTLAKLKRLREDILDPKVADYGGRIVDTAGDGFLIEFSSAVDAVQHAVDLQQATAQFNANVPENLRMDIRIGINVGDVIVDGGDLYGDGVNVAARLEGLAEPGGICISSSAQEQVRHKLNISFEDMGEQHVKNIDDPIRVYRIDIENNAVPRDEFTSPIADTEFLQVPALAVLPFENMGGDPEQTVFADGLTEDIITTLSLWRSFPVIARNSTFLYKDEAVKVQDVGRELGARYVLEGSVRKSGNRVRVTAQLIDAESGHHIWAQKFNREIEDLFDLQDDLTERIAAIVAPELEKAEINRLKLTQPRDLDAWHLVQRGTALLDAYTKEGNARAREMFEQALHLDLTYSRAFTGIALSFNRDLMSGHVSSREESADQALKAARRAVALDSSDYFAHSVLGMALIWSGHKEDAIVSMKRSLVLNPSHGYARATLGALLELTGQSEEGIRMMEDGLRLNPGAPNTRHINLFLSRAYITAHRYEEAIEWARTAIHANPDSPNAHYLLAVSLAHLGRYEEARASLEQSNRLQPGFVASQAEWRPYDDDPTANEHIVEGLRKTGWDASLELAASSSA